MENNETVNKNRYSFDDIMKFSDGWWITTWDASQGRIIKSMGAYKTKDEAKCDVMALNAKFTKSPNEYLPHKQGQIDSG